jgi:hypothetical protein
MGRLIVSLHPIKIQALAEDRRAIRPLGQCPPAEGRAGGRQSRNRGPDAPSHAVIHTMNGNCS